MSIVYFGPPDFLDVDPGSAYVTEQIRGNLTAVGVALREAPVESAETIGVVQRQNAPLHAA